MPNRRDPSPVVACLVAALAVYFTAHHLSSRYRAILWLDALGLSLVTIAGTAKALDAGTGPLVAVVMGVITAAMGGIIRDVLGQEPSILLRRNLCDGLFSWRGGVHGPHSNGVASIALRCARSAHCVSRSRGRHLTRVVAADLSSEARSRGLKKAEIAVSHSSPSERYS